MKLIQDFAQRNAERTEEAKKAAQEKKIEQEKKDEKKDDKRIEADSIDELIAAIKAKLYPEESQDKATEESE